MSDIISVKPIARAEATIKRASSRCCGAKLDVLTRVNGTVLWQCQECGEPCERMVTGEERITLHA